MKKLAWIAGIIVLVLIVGALIVPFFIDVNSYKGLIAQKVKEATGRDITIEGDLSLSLLTGPALTTGRLRLSNLPGGSAPDMITLDGLKVRLALTPLLSGNIQVANITLIKPLILLEKLSNGQANWDFKSASTTSSSSPAPAPSNGASTDIRIDGASIEDGTFIYRDGTQKTEQKVENINLDASMGSLQGPYDAAGGLTYQGQAIQLTVKSGKMQGNGPFPVDAKIGLETGDSNLVYSGTMTLTPLALNGTVSASSTNLAALLAALGGDKEANSAKGPLAQKFAFNGKIKGDQNQAQITEATIQLDDTDAKAAATIAYGSTPIGIGLRVSSQHIDLDKLLEDGKSGDSKTPSDGKKTAAFSLPSNIGLNALLQVDQLVFQKQAIEKVEAKAILAEGKLHLEQLSALLPGNGTIKISGDLTAKQNQPNFQGSVNAGADNLRGLLDAFGVKLDSVPKDRLRRMAFGGKILYQGSQIQLADMKGQLDGVNLTGGVTLALPSAKAPLGFGIAVNVDKINLDAYLPVPEKGQEKENKGKKSNPLTGLSGLSGLNANFDLSAGSLLLQQQQINGVHLQAQIQKDSLTIKNLSVADFLGGSGKINGTIAPLIEDPRFNINFDLGVKDGGTLMDMAGGDRTIGQALGSIQAIGQASGSGEIISYDTKINLSNIAGQGSAKGKLEGLGGELTTDTLLDMAIAKPGPLLQALHIAGGKIDRIDQLGIKGDIQTAKNAVDLNVTMTGLTGQVKLDGNLKEGNFDLAIAADYPQFASLLQALDLPRGANANGPLKANAKAKGNAQTAQIEDLDIRWGQSSLTGKANYTTDGNGRKKIYADLSGGTIDLTPFMASTKGKNAAATPTSRGAPWSKEKFDFSAVEKMDGDVTFQADLILLPDQRIEKPVLKANLQNQLLTISQLTGGLYGGSFDLSGTTANLTNGISLTTQAKINQIQLDQILGGGISGMQVKGPFSLNLQMKGQGDSQDTLMHSLDGQGSLNGQVTILGKVETALGATLLNVLGQKVKQLRSVSDVLNNALSSFTGVANTVTGTFVLQNGIANTEDTKFTNPRAYGTAKGQVDLGGWIMHMLVDLFPNPNATSPFVSVALDGPLDSPKPSVTDRSANTQQQQQQPGGGGLLQQIIPGLGGPSTQPQTQQPSPQPAPVPTPSTPEPGAPGAIESQPSAPPPSNEPATTPAAPAPTEPAPDSSAPLPPQAPLPSDQPIDQTQPTSEPGAAPPPTLAPETTAPAEQTAPTTETQPAPAPAPAPVKKKKKQQDTIPGTNIPLPF